MEGCPTEGKGDAANHKLLGMPEIPKGDLHPSDDEFHDCETDEVDTVLARNVETELRIEDSDTVLREESPTICNNNTNPASEDDKFEDVEKEDLDPMLDDFVDENFLKEEESLLTLDQLEKRFQSAKEFKEQGNTQYQEERLEDSIKSYTKALQLCPLNENEYRAILYGNRGAAKIKLGAKESAVMDCTKSLELKNDYMKVLIRRAALYEEMDKLDEALIDYKKIFEMDSSNRIAYTATQRLPPLINERNEKLKEEMMGKLKDLGNLVLRPFGLSTNNFQLQPTDAGGYTINFKK